MREPIVLVTELQEVLERAPRLDDGRRVIDRPVRLYGEVPEIAADGVVFRAPVRFRGARFSGPAVFVRAVFEDRASFEGSTFKEAADFTGATFELAAKFGEASFESAQFTAASFSDARFDGIDVHAEADFDGARFAGLALFREARIRRASFVGTTFRGPAAFRDAAFDSAEFGRCAFESSADFRGASFSEWGSFDGARFAGEPVSPEVVSGRISIAAEPSLDVVERLEDIAFRRAWVDGPPPPAHEDPIPAASGVPAEEPRGEPDEPDEPASAPASGPTRDLFLNLLQAVGAGAALVGWIVVVGGAIVWARLEAAGVPRPTRTVTLLPRDALVAEGIRALAGVVVVATAVAILVLLLGLNPSARAAAGRGTLRVLRVSGSGSTAVARRTTPRIGVVLVVVAVTVVGILVAASTVTWTEGAMPLAFVVGVVGLLLWRHAIDRQYAGFPVDRVPPGVWLIGAAVGFAVAAGFGVAESDLDAEWWLAVAGGALLLVVLGSLAIAALSRSRIGETAAGVAVVIFFALLVGGGAWKFVEERGNERPNFERARVEFDNGSSLRGLLLAQSGDKLALICGQLPTKKRPDDDRRVLVVSTKDVRQLVLRAEADAMKPPSSAVTCGEPVADKKQRTRDEQKTNDKSKADDKSKTNDKPDTTTGNDKPDTTTGNDKPDTTTGNDKPDTTTGNDKPDTTTGNDKPDTTTGNDKPDTTTGNDKPDTTTDGEADAVPRIGRLKAASARVHPTGTFLLRLDPFEVEVTGVVQLVSTQTYAVANGRRLKLTTHAFRADPNASVTIRAALSRVAMRVLRKTKEMPVQVRITARSMHGRAHTERRDLLLVI